MNRRFSRPAAPMFFGAKPVWRYLLFAASLGAAVLLTVIAEHINHSVRQYAAVAEK